MWRLKLRRKMVINWKNGRELTRESLNSYFHFEMTDRISLTHSFALLWRGADKNENIRKRKKKVIEMPIKFSSF